MTSLDSIVELFCRVDNQLTAAGKHQQPKLPRIRLKR